MLLHIFSGVTRALGSRPKPYLVIKTKDGTTHANRLRIPADEIESLNVRWPEGSPQREEQRATRDLLAEAIEWSLGVEPPFRRRDEERLYVAANALQAAREERSDER